MLCSTALAKGNDNLSIHSAEMNGGQLTATIYIGQEITNETILELRLNDTPFNWDTMTTMFDSPDRGVTWCFVVDTDNVKVGGRQRLDASFLKGFLSGDSTGANAVINPATDNVVLVTTKSYQQYLTVNNCSALESWVDMLPSENETKNQTGNTLADTLSMALDYLASAKDVHERVCVVIVTDANNAISQVSSSFMLDRIAASDMTFYTYATGSTVKADNSRKLAALADSSLAGLPIVNEETDNKDRGETDVKLIDGYLAQIKENENNIYVIHATPGNFGAQGTLLKISLNEGTSGISQTYDLSQPAAAPETTVAADPSSDSGTPTAEGMIASPSPVPTTTGEIIDEPVDGFDLMQWLKDNKAIVIIGAGVLIAGLLLLLLLPKKKATMIPVSGEGDDEPPVPPVNENHSESVIKTEPDDYPPTRAEGVKIYLRSAANPGVGYAAELIDTVVIGRAPTANISLGDDDTYISNLHLRLNYENGNVYAKNMGQNGTKVNGRSISDTVALRPNDQIRIGRSDFIITWTAL